MKQPASSSTKKPKAIVLQGEEAKAFVPPAGWECLPPGDAGLTRKVKAAGPTVTLQEKRGRKVFSKGVWADAKQIANAKAAVEKQRSSASYQNSLEKSRERRAKQQEEYVEDFHSAIVQFLDFAEVHRQTAQRMARLVTAHATPVGSGTVARTKRIPIEQRASAAVIAWMRHQTTAYDDMKIARVKGRRREVRAQLAAGSRKILQRYRDGLSPAVDCPLQAALKSDS